MSRPFLIFFQKDFFNLYCTLTSLRTRQGFVASFISHLGCVALIVSYFKGFVNRFSEKIPDFFHYLRYSPLLWLVSVPSHESNRTLKGLSKRDKVQWLLVANPLLFLLSTVLGVFAAEVPLIDTLIVSYLGRFVKGLLVHFFPSLSQPLLSTEAVREFFPLPLTPIYYHIQKQITRWNNAQIRDKIFM